MPLRIWFPILVLGFLAACQQPGGSASPGADSAATGAGRDAGLRYFNTEFEDLVAEMGDKLVLACGGLGHGGDKLDRCLRDRVAAAFDDSGEGKRNCAYHAELADFIGCVAVGNTFIDMRHRLSDDSPLPGGFWSGGGAMTDALVQSIVDRGIAACGATGNATEGDERQVEACVDRWFEQSLDLPDSMIRRCPPGDGGQGGGGGGGGDHSKERQGCLAEATMVRYMEQHVPRLDAIST